MALGERIKILRKEHGWSQADLATRLNADAGQISRYENGKITPSVEAVLRLADIFDVSCDYLLLDDAPYAAATPSPTSTTSPTPTEPPSCTSSTDSSPTPASAQPSVPPADRARGNLYPGCSVMNSRGTASASHTFALPA